MKFFVGKLKMLQKKFNISENSIDELAQSLAENQDNLNNELSNLINSTLQINPTTSDVNFYLFRVYNNSFLGFNEVQKNYISSILDANDKKIFYDKNDILDVNGRISLEKCINKYNVIVYAIPTTDCPLYYGNKDI